MSTPAVVTSAKEYKWNGTQGGRQAPCLCQVNRESSQEYPSQPNCNHARRGRVGELKAPWIQSINEYQHDHLSCLLPGGEQCKCL
jgi:hypothetical protein